MQKVMITLPSELLHMVDTIVKEIGETRSKFVRHALMEQLEQIKQQRFEALLAEGYQVMAEEDLKDAEAYMNVFRDLGEE